MLPEYNLAKGDYNSFREHMSIDWEIFFQDCINDVETMWKKFKNKLYEGIKKFIPIVKGGKWSRPLDVDIREHIRLKSKLWKKYMATQANQDFLDYKHQQNILRRLVRKDLMEKQNAIELDYRNNPKRLWNYVKSKTKHREIIGDLTVIEDNQEKDCYI